MFFNLICFKYQRFKHALRFNIINRRDFDDHFSGFNIKFFCEIRCYAPLKRRGLANINNFSTVIFHKIDARSVWKPVGRSVPT